MEQFVNLVGQSLIRRGILPSDDLDTFAYGLDMLLFSLATFSALLLLGWLTGCLLETALLASVFSSLQSMGGGYHAQTHLRCFSLMLVGWGASILLTRFVPATALLIFLAFGWIAVIRFAPIEHTNAPMRIEKKTRMKAFVRRLVSFYFIIACICYFVNARSFSAIATAVGMAGISQCVATYSSRRQHPDNP